VTCGLGTTPSPPANNYSRLLQRLAAVHDHGVPYDKGSRVRAQPDDSCGNSSGLPIRPTGSSAITFARPWGYPRCNDSSSAYQCTGTDGINADVLRGIVEGRRSGQAITPCFAAVYAGLPLMPMGPAPEEPHKPGCS